MVNIGHWTIYCNKILKKINKNKCGTKGERKKIKDIVNNMAC